MHRSVKTASALLQSAVGYTERSSGALLFRRTTQQYQGVKTFVKLVPETHATKYTFLEWKDGQFGSSDEPAFLTL